MNAYDMSGISAMTAEPNRFMREILREMLEGLGVGRVLPARSLREAIENLQAGAPVDVLTTELDLDGDDGVELINAVRSHRELRLRTLPIVVISSDTRIPRVMEARDAGATEFVAKPISAHALYRRFAQMIEYPRPFVNVEEQYFGPDRRRQMKGFTGGDKRGGDNATSLMRA